MIYYHEIIRADLFALHRRVLAELAPLTLDHPDRAVALANLRHIRCALARPDFHPR